MAQQLYQLCEALGPDLARCVASRAWALRPCAPLLCYGCCQTSLMGLHCNKFKGVEWTPMTLAIDPDAEFVG